MTIEELAQRVDAIEAAQSTISSLLQAILSEITAVQRRVAVAELHNKDGLIRTGERIDALQSSVDGLRRDLPSIISESLREVLKNG